MKMDGNMNGTMDDGMVEMVDELIFLMVKNDG